MSVRDDRLRLRGVNTEREEGWRTLQQSCSDTLTLSSTSPLINHSKDAIETRGLHTEIPHTTHTAIHLSHPPSQLRYPRRPASHVHPSACQTHISCEVWKPGDVLLTGTETL